MLQAVSAALGLAIAGAQAVAAVLILAVALHESICLILEQVRKLGGNGGHKK